jgi:hypothetical protein
MIPGQRGGGRVAERQRRSGQYSRADVGRKSRRWQWPNRESSETKAGQRESQSSETGGGVGAGGMVPFLPREEGGSTAHRRSRGGGMMGKHHIEYHGLTMWRQKVELQGVSARGLNRQRSFWLEIRALSPHAEQR